VRSFLDQLSEYAKTLRQDSYPDSDGLEVLDESVLPIFVYYPVSRAVLDIPLRIHASPYEGTLKAWDGALTGTTNFKHFFEWFRDEEDYENKERISNQNYRSNQLEAVRMALAAFLPEFSDFSVQRKPLRMTANKHSQEIRIEQLSDGEKCLIALVADLARRLIIANSPFLITTSRESKFFLEGEGIVLIDEVDLHLHPGWQRMVLPKLTATFPNCQFIVSTHSPQILGEVDARQIRILTQDENNEIHCSIPQQAKGLTSNEILNQLMPLPDGSEVLSRNTEVEKQLNALFRLIDDEKFEQAKAEVARMKAELNGDIPDIVRADALIFMLEPESGDKAV
jgi:predicted ATP-binding protein involved in virulence